MKANELQTISLRQEVDMQFNNKFTRETFKNK
jgi:hypothetical protein